MGTEKESLEMQCENMMNVVVETRQRFTKLCIDYDQKASGIENKLMKLQMDIISDYNIRPRNLFEATTDENNDEVDFPSEIARQSLKIEELKKKLKNTLEVTKLLKQDQIGKRIRKPANVSQMVLAAKQKTNNKVPT